MLKCRWRAPLDDSHSYRRGHWDESIKILDDAFAGLATHANYKRGCATARFFAAMAYKKLGDAHKARTVYFDAMDYHQRDTVNCLASNTEEWTDWHLAEVARREAQRGVQPCELFTVLADQ